MTKKTDDVIRLLEKTLGKEKAATTIQELQQSMDELRRLGQFRQYVKQRKLHLLDSKYALADALLEAGVLK